MTTMTHPIGTKWHPLPLSIGLCMILHPIVLKLMGYFPYPWWQTIVFAIGSEILLNLLIYATIGVVNAISVARHSRKEKQNVIPDK
jgi:hypothetical protein